MLYNKEAVRARKQCKKGTDLAPIIIVLQRGPETYGEEDYENTSVKLHISASWQMTAAVASAHALLLTMKLDL